MERDARQISRTSVYKDRMRKLFAKHHTGTGIILTVLAVFLLTGCFEATSRATEQAGQIEACISQGHIPVPSVYDRSCASFILPFVKETDSLSKEQSMECLQKTVGAARNFRARFTFSLLLFWLFALTAFQVAPVIRRMSFSAQGSRHAIISYIHDQDGQK